MVKVKICGLMEPEDVKETCKSGIDMIGVIVDAPTRRSVTSKRAKDLFSLVPKSVSKVAVIVNKSVSDAVRIAHELNPDYLQTHSSMSATDLKEIKDATGVKIMAVISVPQKVEDPREIMARALEISKVADFLLVDTEHRGAGGGTGLVHDWNVSRSIRETIDKPLILAGGLNSNNVRTAIEFVKPYGVDVASGVESRVGKKDQNLVKRFIQASKGK
jgi:phosphoribosylanthranilate isomerase